MSADIQPYVEDFHRKYGYPVGVKMDLEHILFRIRLISEEFAELVEAFQLMDPVAAADALSDLNYVVNGTAVTFGWPLQRMTAEVHRSNMTKEYDRFIGKPVKGDRYEQPKIAVILAEVLKL